jgi:excinuclease ABC subunit A
VIAIDAEHGRSSAAGGSALPSVAGSAGAADDKSAPLLFSSKFSCPVCDYSLPELEPRLFSFNSPIGACPSCDGLGLTDFFDPNRVVVHPELSLAAGAIRGWDRRNAYYFQLISSLAKHYGFSVDTAWNELEEKTRQAILYGSGNEVIAFNYLTESAPSASTSSRASCPTSSAATGKPSRRR